VHPEVRVLAAEPDVVVAGVLARVAGSNMDARLGGSGGQGPAAALAWARGIAGQLAAHVGELAEATLARRGPGEPAGPGGPESLVAPRRLRRRELPGHEQFLAGQFGVFLTGAARAAAPGGRALLSEGRVLGLYGGAVLDSAEAEAEWNETYRRVAMSYAMAVPVRGRRAQFVTMAAEGFATTAAFANTRLHPGTTVGDRGPAGINALFLPFHVQLTDRNGQLRWLGIMALAGLDNLYDTRHNPAGMVIADYGPDYQFPPPPPQEVIKPEPESEPGSGSGSPTPADSLPAGPPAAGPLPGASRPASSPASPPPAVSLRRSQRRPVRFHPYGHPGPGQPGPGGG
jgi:hypothetical protein